MLYFFYLYPPAESVFGIHQLIPLSAPKILLLLFNEFCAPSFIYLFIYRDSLSNLILDNYNLKKTPYNFKILLLRSYLLNSVLL